jgi:multidrug resistance efflux pump
MTVVPGRKTVTPAETQAKSAPPLRRRLLPLFVILGAVAIAAALIASKPERATIDVAERVWLVDVDTVQPGRHAPTLSLFGRVESRWSAALTAAFTADVVEVPVIEGETVSKGQMLVQLDDRDARLQLAQRAAELAQAEARIASEMRRHAGDSESLPREMRLLALTREEVRRLRDLVAKQVGAQSQLDTARQAVERQAIAVSVRQQAVDEHASRLAELEAARARAVALRDQAQLELERANIVAPYDGRVADVPVSPGQRVRTGDPLVALYSTDKLFIRAQLPSRHVPTVRKALADGEPLAAVAEVDGIRLQARLRGFAADAADATGGVDALFDIIGSDGRLVDQGRFVKLELTLPPRDGLVAVPFEAIYGSDRIYRVDDDNRMRGLRVERVGEVRIDDETRLLVRLPGVEGELRVVTTQLPNAVDGLLVRTTTDG